jgi:BirA family biotin operon repressor/biotin-[acetyl-CoA-carboxylase] ligase
MDFPQYARALARRHHGDAPARILVGHTGSTHRLGRRIVRDYLREGTTPPAADVLAWRQSAGEGRDGRVWSSPPGDGVYASLIRPLAADARIQTLPILVAVAVAEVVDRYLDGRCRLKWPNDLMVGERKLGGLLIDVVSAPRRDAARSPSTGDVRRAVAIFGIGINHGGGGSEFEPACATSLEAEAARAGLAPPPPLATVTREVLAAVDRELAENPAAEELMERYRRRAIHRPGDQIRCRLPDEEVVGRFRGFDDNGFLLLEVAGEERRIQVGVIGDGD